MSPWRLFACAMALAACDHGEGGEEAERFASSPVRAGGDGSVRLTDADRAALGLVVEAVAAGELPDVAMRLGRVRAKPGDEALVVAPISGRIPAAPAIQLGALVEAGAPLVQVVPVLGAADRLSVGVRGAEMQGQIEALEHELGARQAQATREAELQKSNIVSAARLQETETQVAATKAQLDALRRGQVVQARGEAAPVTLRAPIAGTLASLDAPVGAVVSAGDVLARVVKPGPLWIDVAMAAQDDPGNGYEVGEPGSWVAARLVSRGTVVGDDGWRHDRLEVEPGPALPLLPGAVTRVKVARGAAAGVVVPEAALVPLAGGDGVYVEQATNTFVPKLVRVAVRFGGRARLAAGLEAGTKVVVVGAMALRGEALRGQLEQAE